MNRDQSKILAMLTALIVAGCVYALSIEYIQEPIWISLIPASVVIGFLPPFITGGKHPMPARETYLHSFIKLFISILMLLIFAHDGTVKNLVITILPIVVAVVWLFSHLAFRINDRRIFKVKDFFR